MITPIEVAVNRLSELKAEMAELETFLRVYYRLYPQEKLSNVLPQGPKATGSFKPVDKPVDNVESGSHEAHDDTPKTKSPGDQSRDQIASKFKLRRAKKIFGDIFERLIKEAGRPLTRGDFQERIEAMPDAPTLNSEDNAKYLGTLLWRNRDRFRNLPGHGYWLINVPYAPARYDPMTDTESRRALETEADIVEPPPLPDVLTKDLLIEYSDAVKAVRAARDRGGEQGDYIGDWSRARQIEEKFPQVMGRARQSLV